MTDIDAWLDALDPQELRGRLVTQNLPAPPPWLPEVGQLVLLVADGSRYEVVEVFPVVGAAAIRRRGSQDEPVAYLVSALEPDHLAQAIELSRRCLDDPAYTPFGAVVVLGGEVIGTGVSEVVVRRDPTCHAEVQAIRDAAARQDTHLLTGAVMYCSGYPCPMCLAACWWAGISQVVTAATLADSARAGFEDQLYFDQLARSEHRVELRDGYRDEAAAVIAGWRASWGASPHSGDGETSQ